MQELEKAVRGLLHDANFDPEVLAKRMAAKRVLHRLNALPPETGRSAPRFCEAFWAGSAGAS